jgi:uncharacterized RDD family membrane protein YckC
MSMPIAWRADIVCLRVFMELDSIRYAGFWIRALADVLDSLILDVAAVLFGLLALGGLYWLRRLSFFTGLDAADPLLLQALLVAGRVLVSPLYFVGLTYRAATTPGKRVFGIKVVSFDSGQRLSLSQSWVRFLSYGLSYLPMGAGFLMAIFHPQKRALHDLISGSVCVVPLARSGETAPLSR